MCLGNLGLGRNKKRKYNANIYGLPTVLTMRFLEVPIRHISSWVLESGCEMPFLSARVSLLLAAVEWGCRTLMASKHEEVGHRRGALGLSECQLSASRLPRQCNQPPHTSAPHYHGGEWVLLPLPHRDPMSCFMNCVLQQGVSFGYDVTRMRKQPPLGMVVHAVFFKKIFYVYECFCLYLCAPRACLMPAMAGRGHQISCHWS